MRTAIASCMLVIAGCQSYVPGNSTFTEPPALNKTVSFYEGSWKQFLRDLPVEKGIVVDYRGRPVADQEKVFSIIPYDVGNRDLQQCADAIMRLRAEYLFAQNRTDEIGFHFTDGQLFRFKDYCKGARVVVSNNKATIKIIAEPCEASHRALRKYLDVVYTYAGTISLAKELLPAEELETGVVVITPGSPGHCFIIVDEMTTAKGEKLFALAEGYTPAQTIYILRNPERNDQWHRLEKGKRILTASYDFHKYKTGKFE